MLQRSLLLLVFSLVTVPLFAAEHLGDHVRGSRTGGQDRDFVVNAAAANDSHVVTNWIAPGVIEFHLLARSGKVLLSGHAEKGIVEVDGLRFESHGANVDVIDGGVRVATIDLSRQSQIVFGEVGVALFDYLQRTRRNKAPLIQALANSWAKAYQAPSPRGEVSVNSWCDFGAGCACNGATLATVGAVLGTLGAAVSGNWLGYSGGLIGTAIVYNRQLDACPS